MTNDLKLTHALPGDDAELGIVNHSWSFVAARFETFAEEPTQA